MPNSADNSLDPTLGEDSDVIELTEEVDHAHKQAAAKDDFDLFGDDLSMPEFRVPQERSALSTTDPGGVPKAAIFGRKTRPRQHTPALDTLKIGLDGSSQSSTDVSAAELNDLPQDMAGAQEPTEALEPQGELGTLDESSVISLESEVDMATLQEQDVRVEQETMQLPSLNRATGEVDTPEVATPEPAQPEASQPAPDDSDETYDRQELVRTIQMEAVSRDEIELSIDLKRLQSANALDDQRFAPDVINRPPRILNRTWVEGIERIIPEEEVQSPQPPPKPAAPQQAPVVESPQPSAASQSAKPPVKQQPPVQESAPVREQQPAPGRPQRTPTPQRPVAAASPAPTGQKDSSKDPELKGLVQELIEEGVAASAPPRKQPQVQQPTARMSKLQAKHSNWFKDVFSEEFLRTVPRDVDRITERETHFIQESLSLQHGSRILDLACGYGRHAIALTQRKMEVVGLDLSMALLQRALQDAQRRNLSIKFVHGDMRSMNFNEIFDGCYLWQSSFGYFDDVTNFKVLKDIARALKPGGRFLLDVMNRDYVVAEMPSRCWWEGRECIFLEEVDFDYNYSVLHTKRSFIYEDGSPPLEQNSFVRLYGMHEMMQILRNAGFRVLEVSGGLSMKGRFLGTNSDRMIFLLEKALPQQRRG